MTRTEFENLPIGKHYATIRGIRGKLYQNLDLKGERKYYFEDLKKNPKKYILTPHLLETSKIIIVESTNSNRFFPIHYSEIELFDTRLKKGLKFMFKKLLERKANERKSDAGFFV